MKDLTLKDIPDDAFKGRINEMILKDMREAA
jgi:hypothetical protein